MTVPGGGVGLAFGVFVAKRDLGDIGEGHAEFGAGSGFEMDFGGGDAADASGGDAFFAGGDIEDEVFVGFGSDDAEEAGELSFEEAPVEGEFAARENFGEALGVGAAFVVFDDAERADAIFGGGGGHGDGGRFGFSLIGGVVVGFGFGESEEDEGADDGEDNGEAADEGGGAPAEAGDGVGEEEVGSEEDEQKEGAVGGFERGAEAGFDIGFGDAGGRFDGDLFGFHARDFLGGRR